jgi:hypothetical protein
LSSPQKKCLHGTFFDRQDSGADPPETVHDWKVHKSPCICELDRPHILNSTSNAKVVKVKAADCATEPHLGSSSWSRDVQTALES